MIVEQLTVGREVVYVIDRNDEEYNPASQYAIREGRVIAVGEMVVVAETKWVITDRRHPVTFVDPSMVFDTRSEALWWLDERRRE